MKQHCSPHYHPTPRSQHPPKNIPRSSLFPQMPFQTPHLYPFTFPKSHLKPIPTIPSFSDSPVLSTTNHYEPSPIQHFTLLLSFCVSLVPSSGSNSDLISDSEGLEKGGVCETGLRRLDGGMDGIVKAGDREGRNE